MTDPLSASLGGPADPGFDVLADDDRADLAARIEHAVTARSALLDTAIEDSLRHLPALVRGPVKRALGM